MKSTELWWSLVVWSAVGGSDDTEDSPGQHHHSLAGSMLCYFSVKKY